MRILQVLWACLCSATFAYNTQYVDLMPKQAVMFDVAGTPGYVSLRFDVKGQDGFEKPQAKVIDQKNGFECEIDRMILLFSGYNAQTKLFNQQWEVRVNWSPGADLSGCEVEVTHSALPWARAELYMNY